MTPERPKVNGMSGVMESGSHMESPFWRFFLYARAQGKNPKQLTPSDSLASPDSIEGGVTRPFPFPPGPPPGLL